jgi:hypothetical protein
MFNVRSEGATFGRFEIFRRLGCPLGKDTPSVYFHKTIKNRNYYGY